MKQRYEKDKQDAEKESAILRSKFRAVLYIASHEWCNGKANGKIKVMGKEGKGNEWEYEEIDTLIALGGV